MLKVRRTASFLAANLPMARRETGLRLEQARLKRSRIWPLSYHRFFLRVLPVIRCAPFTSARTRRAAAKTIFWTNRVALTRWLWAKPRSGTPLHHASHVRL